MTSEPVLVLAVRGNNAIEISRKMMGNLRLKAEPGTIRGDFGVSNSFNLIHGSDSPRPPSASWASSSSPAKCWSSSGRWTAGCMTPAVENRVGEARRHEGKTRN